MEQLIIFSFLNALVPLSVSRNLRNLNGHEYDESSRVTSCYAVSILYLAYSTAQTLAPSLVGPLVSC